MPQTLVFIYYTFTTRFRRQLIWKYTRFKPSGWKDIGISIFDKKLSVNGFFCNKLLVKVQISYKCFFCHCLMKPTKSLETEDDI